LGNLLLLRLACLLSTLLLHLLLQRVDLISQAFDLGEPLLVQRLELLGKLVLLGLLLFIDCLFLAILQHKYAVEEVETELLVLFGLCLLGLLQAN
jgi:hypothetical protein